MAQHDIKRAPGVTVCVPPYLVPEARRNAVRGEVARMLQLSVIEESCSAWSSPIVLVPKPDGTPDFNAFPMPRVDELIEWLGPAHYLSTLDLTKGYWQVPLTKTAREKTAFVTPGGLYQYTVLIVSVHGASATFQRMMDQLLRPHQAYAAAYIDDIIIHSASLDVHLRQLRAVLGELRKAGHPAKCCLGLEEMAYLGYQVGQGNVPWRARSQPSGTGPAPPPKNR